MAGKSKLTAEVRAVVLSAIQAGQTRETACARGGITVQTLRNWEKACAGGAEAIDESDPERAAERLAMVEFFDDIHLAELVAMGDIELAQRALATGKVPTAKDGKPIFELEKLNANALHFRLERLSKKTWGPVQKVEHSGPDGGPMRHARGVVVLPPEVPLEGTEEPPADGDGESGASGADG